ncbi:MAG TPA: hypothetical protein VNG71_04675, partial [Pyrinomonadaceae bacterium]|nr:hypothetical protein [Pyrinomonadaceae bacterium]
MPSALTYPGVYVEEVPSGVRTITGVATSITAFLGRARRGPVDKAIVINSFGDFESIFGGLWNSSTLGFAVRDFFLNGGGQAIIVRIYQPEPAAQGEEAGPPATASLTAGALKFVAATPGKWGVNLRVEVDTKGVSDEMAKALGAALTKADLFNLTVRDTSTGKSEKYVNLTVKDSPRRVDKVLEANSDLIRYDGAPAPETVIKAEPDELGKLENDLAAAKKKLTDDQNSGFAAPALEDDKNKLTAAKKALDDKLDEKAKAVSDGAWLTVTNFLPVGGLTDKKGLYALEQADLFNILCIPPYRNPTDPLDVDVNLVSAAAAYCEKRRAMLIVDAPLDWTSKDKARDKFNDANNDNVGTRSKNAALYFPRLLQP